MNKELFRYFMALNKDDMKSIAKELGMHEITLYNKLNSEGRNELDRYEIAIIANRWGLTVKDFFNIFFEDVMAKKAIL